MALRIFPIFCTDVEHNRTHCLSKIIFLKKLILDYIGLSVQKGWGFFYFFGLYSKTALWIFPIFRMSVKNNRAPCLSKIFSEKFLIPDYRGLSVKKGFFILLWTLLQNGSRIFPIFCMGVEDNRNHCLSNIVFLK